MNSRERLLAALTFQPVDVIPLQIHPSPAGLYEHGQKLLDLMQSCGHDFGDQSDLTLPVVPSTRFALLFGQPLTKHPYFRHFPIPHMGKWDDGDTGFRSRRVEKQADSGESLG
jgi:hypothetical protein